MSATDGSKITAAAGSVALGVAGGEGGGIGLAVGLSVASNQLGSAGSPDLVEAFIDDSNVTGLAESMSTPCPRPKFGC